MSSESHVEQPKGRIQMHWRHSFPRWLLSINFIYFGNKVFDGTMKLYCIFYLNLFGKMGRVHLEVIYMQHTSSDPFFKESQLKKHWLWCKFSCIYRIFSIYVNIYIYTINYMYIFLMFALLHLRIKFCSQKSFLLVFIFISMLLPFDAKKHFGDIILR